MLKKYVKTTIAVIMVLTLLLCSSHTVFSSNIDGTECTVKLIDDKKGSFILVLEGLKRTVYSFENEGAKAAIENDPDSLIISGNSATVGDVGFEVRKSDFKLMTYNYDECPCFHCCPGYEYLDLDMRNWYHDGIHYCIQNGYLTGNNEDYFFPSEYSNRASVITVFYRISGKPETTTECTYLDIPDNAYYRNAAVWARETGISGGYNETTFAPDDLITREQIATMIFRHAIMLGKATGEEGTESLKTFSDKDSISAYAAEAVAWCVENGIMSGTSSSTISPNDYLTRAQLATVIQRYCCLG